MHLGSHQVVATCSKAATTIGEAFDRISSDRISPLWVHGRAKSLCTSMSVPRCRQAWAGGPQPRTEQPLTGGRSHSGRGGLVCRLKPGIRNLIPGFKRALRQLLKFPKNRYLRFEGVALARPPYGKLQSPQPTTHNRATAGWPQLAGWLAGWLASMRWLGPTAHNLLPAVGGGSNGLTPCGHAPSKNTSQDFF